MSEITFRKIRGRIIPIKTSKKEQRRAQKQLVVSGGLTAASAYATGRLAPAGGMASAPRRIKKRFKFKAARGAGILFRGASAAAGDSLARAVGYEDPTMGAVSAAGTFGAYKLGRKLAKLGRKMQSKAAFRRALNYSKYIPKI